MYPYASYNVQGQSNSWLYPDFSIVLGFYELQVLVWLALACIWRRLLPWRCNVQAS